MNGKESIINSILSKAESTTSNLVNDALEEKAKLIENEKSALQSKLLLLEEQAKVKGEELIKRSLTLADLDSRKIILTAKQKVVDIVYEEAKAKFGKMTTNIYKEFFEKIVVKYAESGDYIMLSTVDTRLDNEWAESVIAKNKLANIKVSSRKHSDVGGIILSNKKFDKSFTVSSIVSDYREQTEGHVLKILFGKDN